MKFYAVRNGRQIGIFTDWNECKQLVTGYKGAEFKGFTTREDAVAYMNGAQCDKRDAEQSPDTAVAYVDGSYNAKTKIFAFGVVILHNGEEKQFNESFDNPQLASMRNVAGEINGSMAAMSYCVENGIKNLHIFYDYTGIEYWCTGAWKANKEGTINYKKFYDEIKNTVNITFHKVKGHSGDKYNDMADALAKAAAGIV